MSKQQQQSGEFGTIYTQFRHKPVQAIKHLIKTKEGECTAALHRESIGDIDIVWGENDANNKGFGLKHIIEKHGKEIKQLGFDVPTFISLIVEHGDMNMKKSTENKILLESKMFRCVIQTKWNGKKRIFLLSAFDLRKKPKS